MKVDEEDDDASTSEDFLPFRLPPAVEKLLLTLDDQSKIRLQAYLEMNNHFGEYPIHLTLREVEKARPGTTDEVFTEAATEARWDRQNRRAALVSEVLLKIFSMVFASSLAAFGAWSAFKIMSASGAGWVQFASGLSLLVFCIGGTAAAAAFATNSGVKFKPQTELGQSQKDDEE